MNLRSLQVSTIFLLLLLGMWSCSKENLQPKPEPVQDAPIARAQINHFIQETVKSEGIFRWSSASNHLLWSAIVRSDSMVAIGYQPTNYKNIKDHIHQIDIEDQEWKEVRLSILSFILEKSQERFPQKDIKLEDLMPLGEELALPVIDIKVFDQALLQELRTMPEVRYVEASGYQMEEIRTRDAGCGAPANNNIPSQDFSTTIPNVKIPWNYHNMNIPKAWSTSTGSGITIALVDTGTSPNQENVGSDFNSGFSQGRFIDRRGFYVSSWWPWASPDGPNDQCGHGTQMAGLLAGPRGSDGNAVGVAYNANLLAMRALADVVILGSREKKGVANAITYAANRSDVKILSMSIGSVFWSDRIADAIYYAYNRGKLILAAAGTSTAVTNWYGVIFPAYMPETIAVTGVKEGNPIIRCNTCHSGNEVDFVAVMQRRTDNSRVSLTLAMSGDVPSSISGSSAATATTAGIAALVWSKNPRMSREQVLAKMKSAASIFPNRDNQYGWGIIDADLAVNL